jgi:manganese-dependent inorganic pyrophosphatase
VRPVYVTGHRSPDLGSIASAIGYAELKGRLDPAGRYVPVRLGDVNAQTRWALERSGVAEPELLPHIHLRARDVMRPECPCAGHAASLRDVGLVMAAGETDLVAITDDEGSVVGDDHGDRGWRLSHARLGRAIHAGRCRVRCIRFGRRSSA